MYYVCMYLCMYALCMYASTRQGRINLFFWECKNVKKKI